MDDQASQLILTDRDGWVTLDCINAFNTEQILVPGEYAGS